jgi:signal transduction histidine kinase
MTQAPSSATSLPESIRRFAPAIVERFVVEIRESGLPPRPLRRDQLIDALRVYLEELASALEPRDPGERESDSPSASEHGEQRWYLGYDLRALVLEYGILHRSILEVVEHEGRPLARDEVLRIRAFLDQGVADAVTRFVATANADTKVAEARAAEAIAVREEVLAVVSHDLRNPLQVVQTGLELIKDELLAVCEKPELRLTCATLTTASERIERASRTMTGLVNDMLDLARLRAGEILLEAGEHEPRQMLSEACAAAAPLAARLQVPLRLDRAEPGLVTCDRERVLQILANLIGNAVKHSPTMSPVTVGCWRAQSTWIFNVRDLGAGVTPEEATKIFEPFKTGATSQAGHGMGLAIAKHLTELHQGRLWVESEPGRGASFFFTLPSTPPF